ncbi:MAG TPA: IclR family transcriptional regulator [Candidatus Acidoferrales bacterium]|jgi:DNA-binding IclR family transcriptional regulator|nr:IclR family transcriptional regulator [Candidatus Acidoferrales bacterium]
MKLPRTAEGKYVVEAVAKAIDLLEAFRDSEELSLGEICQRTKLNKSRGFRLLHTLAARGYVEKAADGGRYRLGTKLFEHAAHVGRDLKQVAQPYMRRLHEQFNETVNLGVLHNGQVLYIDILESSQAFRMAATAGSRMPVFSTSLGKAIAAHLPEAEVAELLSGPQESASRKRAAAENHSLRNELQTVRRRGYAVDNEENESGVACIGAPIFDNGGRAVAAISVSGPVGRILGCQKQIAGSLVSFCREISRKLGFSGRRLNGPKRARLSPSAKDR